MPGLHSSVYPALAGAEKTGQVNTDALQGPGVPRRRPAASPAAPLAPSAGCEVKRESLSRVRLLAVSWTIQSMGFSRSEYWSGEPFPSPGDLPNPGIEPRFPAWQVDSLPAEPQGMPKNGVGSLFLFQGIFPTQEWNQGLLHGRRVLYQLSHQGLAGPCLTRRSSVLPGSRSLPARRSRGCARLCTVPRMHTARAALLSLPPTGLNPLVCLDSCSVAQSCPALCDPVACGPPGPLRVREFAHDRVQ